VKLRDTIQVRWRQIYSGYYFVPNVIRIVQVLQKAKHFGLFFFLDTVYIKQRSHNLKDSLSKHVCYS